MKRIIIILAVALLLFTGLPVLAVAVLPSEFGMMACVFLLMLFNPIFFVVAGALSAGSLKIGWLTPAICAVIFFVSAKLTYGMGEWIYVVFYLAIAYAAMVIGYFVQRKKFKKAEQERMNVQDL